MNKPARQLATLVILMFLALMATATYIQFFDAEKLAADDRNVRTLYAEYGTERGKIIVNGEAIATSVPAEGVYKFQRTYADSELYSHLTGYFSTAFSSMTGLERAENSLLGGSASELATQRLQELVTGTQPQGGSVELTIDPAVQRTAYQALGNQTGAVVALDPATGAILAQVSTPSFDANLLAQADANAAKEAWAKLQDDPGKPLVDRAIAGDQYAPGSVFKLVTAAAMLEANEELTADTVVDAPTTWQPPDTDRPIQNYGGAVCGDGSGKATLRTTFIESCNTSFAIAVQGLGKNPVESGQILAEQAKKFGFGTSFETPLNVTASRFPAPESAAALAMDSIGQNDVMATPMQMAMVAAAVANKGELMEPYLVSKTYTADLELLRTTSARSFGAAMSERTAAIIAEMMVEDVRSGTGKAAAIAGIDVAGKTGTAEIGEGQAPHAWFVAYAPADNPTIALAVVVENSGNAGMEGTGGTVAAPIAQKIIQARLASAAQ